MRLLIISSCLGNACKEIATYQTSNTDMHVCNFVGIFQRGWNTVTGGEDSRSIEQRVTTEVPDAWQL